MKYIFIFLLSISLYSQKQYTIIDVDEKAVPEFFGQIHGGTWGEEPNFGIDATVHFAFLTARTGYVFATTEKETFHLSVGIIPYQNDWYRAMITWGGTINARKEPKLIIDNWFKIAPGAFITVGVQSVFEHAYWNAGFSLQFATLGGKTKPRRFY